VGPVRSLEQGERFGFAEQCTHLREGGRGLLGRDDGLGRVAAGQSQFAQPEQGSGGGQRYACGVGQIPGTLQRVAGLAEFTLPEQRDAKAPQDVRLPVLVAIVADLGQRPFEHADGVDQLAYLQIDLSGGMQHLRLDSSARHLAGQPQGLGQQFPGRTGFA
jgi:hypothetical protein